MKSSVLHFLQELEQHNNREWFNAHKEQYNHARGELTAFVEELILAITRFDKEIGKVDPAKSLFRIYRDTRFSQNKAPYKTNFGASITCRNAGYYLHIQPGKSFLAGGIYMPENDRLKMLRKEISGNAATFQKILGEKSFRHYFGGLSEEGKLQRVPAGFDKEDPMAGYLKLKHFVAVRPVADKELLEKGAPQKFAAMYKSLKPLKDFLNAPLL